MYSVYDYGRMILDEARMDAYLRALELAVKPGAIVVDVGAGTGIFSLYACKLGAARVYAIDPNPAADLIPAMAAENGWSDRVVVHRAPTHAVRLPERADVIVWDVRGQLGLVGLEAMIDARDHFLAPGGAMIPLRDKLMLALVDSEALYEPFVAAWRTDRFGFSQRAARESVLMSAHTDRAAPLTVDAIISKPCAWGSIDFATAENGRVVGGGAGPIERDGTAHAVAVWFETEIAPGIGFSTGPAPTSMVYARMVLPLLAPTEVRAGDEARVKLHALPSVEDYVWAWDTEFTRAGARYAGYRQSSFFADPLTTSELRKTATDYAPRRTAQADAELLALSLFDGTHSLDAIAERLGKEYPDLFCTRSAALAEAKRIASRLGR